MSLYLCLCIIEIDMSVWSRADYKCASQELPFSIDFDSTLFLLPSLFLYHWPRVEWIFTILVGVFLLTLSFCAELRFSVFYKNQSGVPHFVRLFSFSLFLNRSSRMYILIMDFSLDEPGSCLFLSFFKSTRAEQISSFIICYSYFF